MSKEEDGLKSAPRAYVDPYQALRDVTELLERAVAGKADNDWMEEVHVWLARNKEHKSRNSPGS